MPTFRTFALERYGTEVDRPLCFATGSTPSALAIQFETERRILVQAVLAWAALLQEHRAWMQLGACIAPAALALFGIPERRILDQTLLTRWA